VRVRRWSVYLFLTLVALSGWAYFFPQPPKIQLQVQPDLPGGHSTLVIAPHEDDEALGAAGLIQESLARGDQVHVVLVTSGDAYRAAADAWRGRLTPTKQDMIDFGKARQQETLKAMRILGLPAEDITFLGYPDQGTASMWLDYWDTPFTSPYTGVNASPYGGPARLYTGTNLLTDLEELIRKVHPATIAYPHPNDAHVDHWAVHNFTVAALEDLRRTEPGWVPPSELLYIVHRGDWPAPKGMLPGKLLMPPAPLLHGMTTWVEQPLTAAEIARKEEAVRAYGTQITLMRRYLLSFVRASELYGKLPRVILPTSPMPLPQWAQVATDPAGDSFSRELDPTADVVGVEAARDDETLYLRLQLRGGVSSQNYYVAMAHGYRTETGWSPLMRVQWHPPNQLQAAQPPGVPPVRAYGASHAAEFAVPLRLLGYPDAVMVGFETRFSGMQVDRTSWRLINLN